MAKTSKAFSGEDFLRELRTAGDPPAVFTGMVKPAEDGSNSLMFARPGDCSHWVKIPVSMIDHVEPLPSVACGGHSHRMAHLHLAEPAAPDAKAFAGLAQLHRAAAAPLRMVQPALAANAGSIECPGGATPYWDAATGQWRCP